MMSSRQTHNIVNRILLGKDYNQVSAIMDFPSKFLGPGHRRFFHDLKTTPLLMAVAAKDPRAGLAAALHIITDKQKLLIDKRIKRSR